MLGTVVALFAVIFTLSFLIATAVDAAARHIIRRWRYTRTILKRNK